MSESLPRPGRATLPDSIANDLLIAVASGDERAFEQFYGCVAGMVLGTARRILHDSVQAEEVTRDVLLELWRIADRYAPEKGSAIGWTMMLAHRRAVDRLRSLKAAGTRSGVPPHTDAPQLDEALARLSPEQRDPLVLAYCDGLTCEEIAAALRIPMATAQGRMRAGLIQLRDSSDATA